jgi:hypothetical protein
MPSYDYLCEANGRVVEVKHRMSDKLSSWGQLCETAGIETGDTPADAPVQRLATGGQVVKSSSLGDAAAPPCAAGGCGGGMCGLGGG